jgi:ferredoxin
MFTSFLAQHDVNAWAQTRDTLLSSIHEVDRDATRIWFHFFPLPLADAVAQSGDVAQLARQFELEGRFRLSDQVDASHWFLYGHRYWPQVKAAILSRADSQAASPSLHLDDVVRAIAADVASSVRVEASIVVGITLVGVMTLRQVGIDAFRRSAGTVEPPSGLMMKSPAHIVQARAIDDSQGLFGALRGIRSQYSVQFDERHDRGRFRIINGQHLTTASAAAPDKRADVGGTRRLQEGPIPIRCKSGACGSCWFGVLGGAQKLTPIEPFEAQALQTFGYSALEGAQPLIRLACQARASGNVTIVIPPWQGIVGKLQGMAAPYKQLFGGRVT